MEHAHHVPRGGARVETIGEDHRDGVSLLVAKELKKDSWRTAELKSATYKMKTLETDQSTTLIAVWRFNMIQNSETPESMYSRNDTYDLFAKVTNRGEKFMPSRGYVSVVHLEFDIRVRERAIRGADAHVEARYRGQASGARHRTLSGLLDSTQIRGEISVLAAIKTASIITGVNTNLCKSPCLRDVLSHEKAVHAIDTGKWKKVQAQKTWRWLK